MSRRDCVSGILGNNEENSINNGVYNHVLAVIQRSIHSATGINIGQYKDDFLIRRILKRAEKLGINASEYAELLRSDKQEMHGLLDDLTVNHTSFFRDINKYRVFKKIIIPELLRENKNRSMRVWSAGCAGGEEPYSIAIILHEFFGDRIRDWDIKILASDISLNLLERARKGAYSEDQLLKNKVDAELVRKYFHYGAEVEYNYLNEKMLKVNDKIKSLIQFRKHNLISDGYPGNMDVVFCRNVMIYVKFEFTRQVILKFHKNLNENGYLVLGNFETLDTELLTEFERIKSTGEFVYKKISYGSDMHARMLKRQKSIKAGLGIKE